MADEERVIKVTIAIPESTFQEMGRAAGQHDKDLAWFIRNSFKLGLLMHYLEMEESGAKVILRESNGDEAELTLTIGNDDVEEDTDNGTGKET